jgi:sugar-specific transcriptional regulator TrmB
MYQDIFTKLGLTQNEAIIYDYLLRNGEITAGEIIKNTTLQRGVAYNTLSELVNKGLVIQKTREKVARFYPAHPEKIREFMEEKEKEVDKAKKSFEANWGSILSNYNLHSQKPGVQYFEGLEGVKRVLSDTLTSKEMIYTYADIEAIVKYINKINQEYVAARDKLGINKKAIVVDSPFARQYLADYHRSTTDMKFVDHSLYPFNSVMQIYDGKVAYITLSDISMIGVIINDQNIYQMHKSIFEFTWNHAWSFDQLSNLSNTQ